MDFTSYELTKHARGRLLERKILFRHLEQTLATPDVIGHDAEGHFLLKKGIVVRKAKRVLIVAGLFRGKVFRILTVIDSTKIDKYL